MSPVPFAASEAAGAANIPAMGWVTDYRGIDLDSHLRSCYSDPFSRLPDDLRDLDARLETTRVQTWVGVRFLH